MPARAEEVIALCRAHGVELEHWQRYLIRQVFPGPTDREPLGDVVTAGAFLLNVDVPSGGRGNVAGRTLLSRELWYAVPSRRLVITLAFDKLADQIAWKIGT
jgi:hypothetical protein